MKQCVRTSGGSQPWGWASILSQVHRHLTCKWPPPTQWSKSLRKASKYAPRLVKCLIKWLSLFLFFFFLSLFLTSQVVFSFQCARIPGCGELPNNALQQSSQAKERWCLILLVVIQQRVSSMMYVIDTLFTVTILCSHFSYKRNVCVNERVNELKS